MNTIEHAFTLIHIKISNLHVFKISARHFVSFLLILLSAYGLYELFQSTIEGFLSFLESALYLLFITCTIFLWVKSWPKAKEMLNKASGYEDSCRVKYNNAK